MWRQALCLLSGIGLSVLLAMLSLAQLGRVSTAGALEYHCNGMVTTLGRALVGAAAV